DYVGAADSFDSWWQRLDIEPGRHRIVFRSPGFQPYLVDMRILPGQDFKIKYQMVPGNDDISEKEMRGGRPRHDGNNRRGYYEDQRNHRDQEYNNRNRDYDRDENENNRDENEYNERDQEYNQPQYNQPRHDQDHSQYNQEMSPNENQSGR